MRSDEDILEQELYRRMSKTIEKNMISTLNATTPIDNNSIPIKESHKIMSRMCMTKDVGMGGNLFGGYMLAWADEASAIFARTYTGMERFVTKHITDVDFKYPVKVGTILDFVASGVVIGNTSITFNMTVYDTNVDKTFKNCNTVYLDTKFTMVAVDENGKRTSIQKK